MRTGRLGVKILKMVRLFSIDIPLNNFSCSGALSRVIEEMRTNVHVCQKLSKFYGWKTMTGSVYRVDP